MFELFKDIKEVSGFVLALRISVYVDNIVYSLISAYVIFLMKNSTREKLYCTIEKLYGTIEKLYDT